MPEHEKIGILGGTFNPPHRGHTYIAEQAYNALGLSRVIFIPSKIPPHKSLPSCTPPPEQRMDMLKIAASGMDFAQVSDIELARGGKSYTIDTLAELARQTPDAEFYFIIGADMLLTFEQWRDFAEIFKLSILVVFSRAGNQHRRLCEKASEFETKFGARIKVLPSPCVPICSTEIRRDLNAGIINDNLDKKVFEYIRANGLYGWNERLYMMRERVKSMVSPQRYRHIMGCELMAAALAERWGADVLQARTAAVLHDITREFTREKQLKLCDKYGIITDDVLKLHSALLHSITGAELCRREFGVSEDVCSAIRWHTTGHADMTLLEKIIYLADGIEQTRDYSGIHTPRRLAFTDLDAAVRQSLSNSIRYVTGKGCVVCEDTLAAYKFLCENA